MNAPSPLTPIRPANRRPGLGRGSLALAGLLLAALAARADENDGPARPDLQSFRIISERNIFDPNRSNRRDDSSRREREPDRERPARVETVSLLGTMSYERGRYAFFDGSSSDFRKVVQPADTIAGFKVTEVAPGHVKLESTNGPPLELRVGMQMNRREDEAWRLAEPAELRRAPTGDGIAAPSADAETGGPESEVLKRLMQQREQELQK